MADYSDLLKALRGEQNEPDNMMSIGEPAPLPKNEIEQANEQATSPYIQEAPEQDLFNADLVNRDIQNFAKKQIDSAQNVELTDVSGDIPELTPQEKLIEEMRKIREQKGQEAKTAQEKADRNALIANAIRTLGTIAQADIQRSAGVPIGIRPTEMVQARDIASTVLKDRDAMLKNLMDEYRLMQQPKGELSPYQKRNLELQEKRLELLEGKEGRLTEKDKLQEEVKSRLSDKEVKDISQLDDGRRILDEIEGILKETDIEKDLGPYASRIEQASAYIPGIEKDPNFVKMQQLVGINLADYVKSISGAQVSEQEAQRLLKNIPNMTDKPGEFKTKLKTFRKELEGAREDYLKNIGKQKKSAEKFMEKPTAQKEEQKVNEVKRRTKDGRIAVFNADTKQFLRYED